MKADETQRICRKPNVNLAPDALCRSKNRARKILFDYEMSSSHHHLVEDAKKKPKNKKLEILLPASGPDPNAPPRR